MKNILFYIILFSMSFCSQNKNPDIELINNFINKVIIDNSSDYSEYIEMNSSKKELLDEYIQMNINDLKSQIQNKSYKIVHLPDVKDFKMEFQHKNLNEVYLLESEEEIIGFFIVKDSKIISFFSEINKEQNNLIYPFYLNTFYD